MKICFIVNSLQSRSGVERVVILLANSFVQKNLEVTLINRDTEFEQAAFSLKNTVKVISLYGNLLNFFSKLNKHFSQNKYDIILIHNMGKLTPFCSFLTTTIPKISLEHVSFNSRPSWVRIFSRLTYIKINQVITINHNDKLLFKNIGNNKVTVIYNPSPFGVVDKRSDLSLYSKKIIAVGRLNYQKNFHHLIEAWALLKNKAEDYVLEIYGDGEDKISLNQLINDYKIKNAVILSNTADIRSVYEQSSFLVMSSRYEGLPMVLIEALSFGLPIISYNCPHGPSEIIEHKINGLLVENQCIKKLSAAIQQMIDDNSLQKKLSEGALITAKNYDINTITQQWIELFDKVKK